MIAGYINSKKEFKEKIMAKIYERNPDTGKVRSREIKEPTSTNIREEILSEVWAANKRVVDGKWYVELSQVAEIIGGKNV